MKIYETFFPDHFDQADRVGVFFGLFVMVISLYLLYEVRPNTGLRSNKTIAQLSIYTNNVKFKEAGSVAFYEVRTKENFQSNDEIFTGRDSEASVKFLKTGSVLKIPSSSLVRIEEGDDGDIIEVKDGVVSLQLEKDQSVNLSKDGVIHTIRSTDKNSVKIFNTEGQLRVLPNQKGLKLKTNEGEKEFKQDLATNVPLQYTAVFNLLYPQAGSIISYDTELDLTVDVDDSYTVQISKFADFSKTIESTKFKGKKFTWNLNIPDGDYFLKVQTDDNSRTVPITLVTRYQIEDLLPPNGTLATVVPEVGLKLSWKAIPTNNYYVHLKDEKGIVRSEYIKQNEFQVRPIAGKYLDWNVTSKVAPESALSLMSFNRVNLSYEGEIRFTASADKKEYQLNEKELKLSWLSSSPSTYEVKVTDIDSNTELMSTDVREASLTLPLSKIGELKIDVGSKEYPTFKKATTTVSISAPVIEWVEGQEKIIKTTDIEHRVKLSFIKNTPDLSAVEFFYNYKSGKKRVVIKPEELDNLLLSEFGDYCFGAVFTTPQKYLTNPKDFCLKLVQLPPFPTLPRAQDSVLEYTKEDGGLETYIVKVPAMKEAVQYEFSIYKDNKGKNLVFKDTTSSPEFKWTTRRAGVFYLQYKVTNKRGRSSGLSPFSRIIFPISPLSNW